MGKPCGADTTGDSMREYVPCNSVSCPSGAVDCIWAEWTPFSACRNDGQRYRERDIQQAAKASGMPCAGAAAELTPCGKKHCQLSPWTTWSSCDKSCDGGQRARHRQIQSLPRWGGELCPLPLETWELEGCNKDGCHPNMDCNVGSWSSWAGCTVSCGYGQETRSRNVINIRRHHGQGCVDNTDEMRKCMPKPCNGTKHCHYNQWTPWTQCTTTCGGGEQTRERSFLTTGLSGGAGCHAPEDMKQVQAC